MAISMKMRVSGALITVLGMAMIVAHPVKSDLR